MLGRRKSPPANNDRRAESSRRPSVNDRSDDTRRATRRPPQFDDEGYEDHPPFAEWCLQNRDLVNDWKLHFLIVFRDFERPSRQWHNLLTIGDKIELGLCVLRNRRSRR
jgi:hypothetical protein